MNFRKELKLKEAEYNKLKSEWINEEEIVYYDGGLDEELREMRIRYEDRINIILNEIIQLESLVR